MLPPLPELRFPFSNAILADALTVRDDDAFANVPRGQGTMRRRRVFTVQQRRVGFELMLTPEQAAELDEFFERVTIAGSLAFSIRLPSIAPGRAWWRAVFGPPYTSAPVPNRLGMYWRARGEFVLEGPGSATPPTSGTLVAGFRISLGGSASIKGTGALAVQFNLAVTGEAPLRVEFFLPIEQPGYEPEQHARLREGGGRRLREDGGLRLLEI